MVKNIVWFSELKNTDVAIAGGKGASLGEMYNIKLPIPSGFVVTAQAFKKFLDYTGLGKKIFEILESLKADETEKIHDASEKIQELVLDAQMPEELKSEISEAYETMNVNVDVYKALSKTALSFVKAGRDQPFVAVRSSATAEDLPTASFAGQQKSFMNIKGNENLVNAVQNCWASLYTARAIYYRIKNEFLHEKVFIAVVVQKMVNSDASGVMFTINPATNNEDEIMIEAGYGLGDAIVGGEITPDEYIIDKSSLKIKSIKLSKQLWCYTKDERYGRTIKKNLSETKGSLQKLTDEQIIGLAKYAKQIEAHYARAMDIEYAVENNKLFIVQARPVTTQKKVEGKKDIQVSTSDGANILLTGMGASPGIGEGRVKIIRDISELKKVLKGDVMVANMTDPDMVPAMERAVAIITNEGGVTCFGSNTNILTNEGFMNIESAYEKIKSKEDLMIFSYNTKNKKPIWKKIVNAGKRKRELVQISVSQKGELDHNTLDITPDHKMYTFNNRTLIKKPLNKLLEDEESLCLVEKLPKLKIEKSNEQLSYLLGSLMSDGNIKIDYYKTGNPRRGRVTFTQKQTEKKEEFINYVKTCYSNIFDENFDPGREKTSSSYIRGRYISGVATDFISTKLEPAKLLLGLSQNIDSWLLNVTEPTALNFLAGLIDGDGCLHENRLHIYVSKENVLKGVITSCLKLGILPQITKNRHIHHVQIVERIEDILNYTKRVKGDIYNRTVGTKFFSAKQLLSDIIDEVNWGGKIKPYVKKNLLLDKNKILNRVIPMADSKIKNELLEIVNSNLRMNRVRLIEKLGENYVYNLEVEADEEIEHCYVVFTKKYTPLLVSNSHAAIVSRELGIPAVVGTEKATQVLKDGDLVTVDGYTGRIYKGAVELKGETRQEDITLTKDELHTKTKIYMNLSEPDLIDEYKDLPFDGIGLMRVEFIVTDEIKKHPLYLIRQGKQNEYIDKLAAGIEKVASAVNNKPVIVRFSDFKTNEYSNLEGGNEFEPHESNPMIGWRGVSRYVSDEYVEAFKMECKAILKVRENCKNVYVMLPFVRKVEEVKRCLYIMKKEGLVRSKDFKIFLMGEVPAIAFIPEEFAKLDIDGVSIGSNDLTQLTLGVDRDSAKLGRMGYFDERDPAVLLAIKRILEGFKKHGKITSICGQSPSEYKEIVEFLIENHIDDISVNPDVVKKTRHYVSEAERKL